MPLEIYARFFQRFNCLLILIIIVQTHLKTWKIIYQSISARHSEKNKRRISKVTSIGIFGEIFGWNYWKPERQLWRKSWEISVACVFESALKGNLGRLFLVKSAEESLNNLQDFLEKFVKDCLEKFLKKFMIK